MNAVAFASPRLLEAARAAAPLLALVPRVPPPAKVPRVVSKPRLACQPRPYPSTHREERMLQAAEYFISRYPKATIYLRLRFGRAYGFSTQEFFRAIRVARENLSRGGDVQHRDMHPNAPSAQGAAGGEVTLRSERLECREPVWGNAAADAGSCATTFTASRSESQTSPASSRELRPCVSEPLGAAVQFSNHP